jgi:hypothetical protein
LEVQEAMLAEVQVHGLDPFNGQDLLAELKGIHVHMDGIKDERTAEARQLSQLVRSPTP